MTDPVISHLLAALVPLAAALTMWLRSHAKRSKEVVAVLSDVRKELAACQKDRVAQSQELAMLRADLASGRCPVCAARGRHSHG